MPFVPVGFKPPEVVEAEGFDLKPLTIHDAIIDYDAVMTSIDSIRDSYWRAPGWPFDDLSLMQNIIDLGWHTKEREFQTSFAYIAVAKDEYVELGCLYIDPSIKRDFDADVQMWVRASERDSGLDERLYETVRTWIARDWPFERVAYPGREYSREQWGALPDRPER